MTDLRVPCQVFKGEKRPIVEFAVDDKRKLQIQELRKKRIGQAEAKGKGKGGDQDKGGDKGKDGDKGKAKGKGKGGDKGGKGGKGGKGPGKARRASCSWKSAVRVVTRFRSGVTGTHAPEASSSCRYGRRKWRRSPRR